MFKRIVKVVDKETGREMYAIQDRNPILTFFHFGFIYKDLSSGCHWWTKRNKWFRDCIGDKNRVTRYFNEHYSFKFMAKRRLKKLEENNRYKIESIKEEDEI